jgi:hypothetical protein
MGNRAFTHAFSPVPPGGEERVGLFYFLWLGEHGRGDPRDISKITAEHPDAGQHPEADYWGGIGFMHHWGEPFYGYYYSDDEWVVRRHMKLILQAGIDFLFFDTTNAVIYEKNAKLVLRVLEEYYEDGWDIPKVMFYTNTRSGDTVQRIYEAIYKPGYCRDAWFLWDGKPVIIAVPEDCSEECRAFFTIKLSQWPNEPDKAGGWPWMDFVRPQRVFPNLDGVPECINVSVAQHPQIKFGDSVLYGETANRGRAFHDGRNDPAPDAWTKGYNFSEQFERALEVRAPVTLVTGWNEWIAGRWQGTEDRPIMFVDCCNQEYSRDIEMMRGGYFDNYYKLLCSYTAKLKGEPAEVVLKPGESADFRGYPDGSFNRDAEGYGTRYVNRTGRYCIRKILVSREKDGVRFTLESDRPFDPDDRGGCFMRLWVWNAEGEEIPASTLIREEGENRVTVTVPAERITGPYLDFKAADSREEIRTPEDFYDHGDVLPLGYAKYRVCLSD